MFRVKAGNGVRQAGLDDGLARRVLADAGGQHLAHDDFADAGRIDAGLGQQLLDDLRAEFGGRDLRERAAEFADAVRPAATMTTSSISISGSPARAAGTSQ
jgi:hypothetical protein